jgi:hypothetical protein
MKMHVAQTFLRWGIDRRTLSEYKHEISLFKRISGKGSNDMTFYIFYHGRFISTLGPHWGLQSSSEATDKYRSLHPELNWDEIAATDQRPVHHV